MNQKQPETHNALDSDLTLKAQISEALVNHPSTTESVIEVINDRGIITLEGEVTDAKAREAAEAIVESHPGVITVINSLKIRR